MNNGVRIQRHTLKGSLLSNSCNIETTEEVINMANKEDAINAAKKSPSARTPEEQLLVDRNWGMQAVRNTDHEARRQSNIHGH